jgi:hypothetical protein
MFSVWLLRIIAAVPSALIGLGFGGMINQEAIQIWRFEFLIGGKPGIYEALGVLIGAYAALVVINCFIDAAARETLRTRHVGLGGLVRDSKPPIGAINSRVFQLRYLSLVATTVSAIFIGVLFDARKYLWIFAIAGLLAGLVVAKIHVDEALKKVCKSNDYKPL